MKNSLAGILLAALAGVAQADDLAKGIEAWEAQDFTSAHQVLGKLAMAGNAEAQLMLGEMYGLGEGVPENKAQAEGWLAKAQAGGNPNATAALETLKQRSARKADIAYYVSGHTTELTLTGAGCVKPALTNAKAPQTQHDIRSVRKAFVSYEACYKRFGQALAARTIPQDVARLMSLPELQQAKRAMDEANAAAAAEGAAEAGAVVAAYNEWAVMTHDYALVMKKSMDDLVEQDRHEADIAASRRRSVAMLPARGTR